jgi:phosphoglycolate phosphatase
MARYQHIIWDWNGTLLDDAWLCIDIVNGLLAKRSLPALSAERYQEIFDFPVKEYYRRLGFDFSKEPYEELAAEFIQEYERRRFECRLHKGARETLENMHSKGMNMSILSAYAQTSLEQIVRFFGIHEFFHGLFGLDNFYAGGKVDIGKLMVRDLPCAASAIVLVGDTTHDFSVAKAMGIVCILVPGGHQSRSRLSACTTYIIDSLAELATRIA